MSDADRQEEELYAKVAAELHGGNREEGLWAKCFAECDGDENKAKALYLKARVERLKEEEPNQKKDIITLSHRFEEMRAMANRGDARAQNSLGEMYFNGEGVEKDERKAVVWYRKGSREG